MKVLNSHKRKKNRKKRTSPAPGHRKLPWPGLKAKDHLSRVVTRAVKEAKEAEAALNWAKAQIDCLLDYVSAEAVLELLLCEMRRRNGDAQRVQHLDNLEVDVTWFTGCHFREP